MDDLAHVLPGDPRRLRPGAWNALVDAARAHQRSRLDGGGDAVRDVRPTDVVVIRNDTATDLPRFAVVGLGAPLAVPVDNVWAFLYRARLSGVVPTAAHAGRFGVLLEAVPADGFGRACVAGVFPARVKINDENHVLADVKVGYTDYLDSAGSGVATLLWVEPAGDRDPVTIAWALIRIGGGGGGAASAFAMITSRSGTEPPYNYTAIAAVMDIDGVWSEVSGGAEYSNVRNLEESGTGGQWVNPLMVGDPIELSPAPGGADAYVCRRAHYRGTY